MEMAIKRKHFAHFNSYLAPRKNVTKRSEQDTQGWLQKNEAELSGGNSALNNYTSFVYNKAPFDYRRKWSSSSWILDIPIQILTAATGLPGLACLAAIPPSGWLNLNKCHTMWPKPNPLTTRCDPRVKGRPLGESRHFCVLTLFRRGNLLLLFW